MQTRIERERMKHPSPPRCCCRRYESIDTRAIILAWYSRCAIIGMEDARRGNATLLGRGRGRIQSEKIFNDRAAIRRIIRTGLAKPDGEYRPASFSKSPREKERERGREDQLSFFFPRSLNLEYRSCGSWKLITNIPGAMRCSLMKI